MRSLLDKTLDLAFGAAAVTREKAQEFVDDLVKRGEAARDESGTLVEEIVRRGQKQREDLQTMIQREVAEAVSRVNIATRDDLERLERRIQVLEVFVEDMRGGEAVAARPVVLPPEAGPATKVVEVAETPAE